MGYSGAMASSGISDAALVTRMGDYVSRAANTIWFTCRPTQRIGRQVRLATCCAAAENRAGWTAARGVDDSRIGRLDSIESDGSAPHARDTASMGPALHDLACRRASASGYTSGGGMALCHAAGQAAALIRNI